MVFLLELLHLLLHILQRVHDLLCLLLMVLSQGLDLLVQFLFVGKVNGLQFVQTVSELVDFIKVDLVLHIVVIVLKLDVVGEGPLQIE